MTIHVRAVLTLGLLVPSAGCQLGSRSATGSAVDLATAVNAAVAHSPGRAVSAKMKTKDGAIRFEVDVLAADGSVTEVDVRGDGTPESRMPWDPAKAKQKPKLAAAAAMAQVDLPAALSSALAVAPGTVTEAELDGNETGAVWKIEIRTAAGSTAKVKVDAASGQVLPS